MGPLDVALLQELDHVHADLEALLVVASPEHFLDVVPHLVKFVLDLLRQTGSKTAHPGEVLLAALAPAAEAEPRQQGLLALLQREAEVVDPVVVGDLLPGQDLPLSNHQNLTRVQSLLD